MMDQAYFVLVEIYEDGESDAHDATLQELQRRGFIRQLSDTYWEVTPEGEEWMFEQESGSD